eukprot:gene30210-36496_t
MVCEGISRSEYVDVLVQNCLPKIVHKHSEVIPIPILRPSQLSSSKSDKFAKDSASLFVWFSDEELSAADETTRKECTFSLCLLSPMEDDRVRARNQKLLKVWADRLLGLSERPSLSLEAGRWSHFLCLTYPDLSPHQDTLSSLLEGIDAVELRVDLLADKSVSNIHKQLSILRSVCALPIIFTLRTQSQLGKHEDADFDGIERLLLEGVRAGVEWLDLEAHLPSPVVTRVLAAVDAAAAQGHRTRVLGSLHTTALPTEPSLQEMLLRTSLAGKADMCKVVTGAAADGDCHLVQRAVEQFSSIKPCIGLCLGPAGELSRVMNERFTPVTHPSLAAAAPGQLCAKSLMQRREKLGLVGNKHFYLLGSPIKQSLSPAMHNAAYRHLYLPYSYQLAESDNVQELLPILRSATFGGASVTIPHKESIMRYLDDLDEHASRIGAVNTIVVRDQGLKGYNTDWLGMLRPLRRLLKMRQLALPAPTRGIGLVIGAGGTARAACYVMKKLGLDLYISNRTPDHAKELARRFNGTAVSSENILQDLDASRLSVIISTLPASASLTVPTELLKSQPVVLDVVYEPASTVLLQQAIAADCLVVQGATMLLEQGLGQFELWNERQSPRDVMIFYIAAVTEVLPPAYQPSRRTSSRRTTFILTLGSNEIPLLDSKVQGSFDDPKESATASHFKKLDGNLLLSQILSNSRLIHDVRQSQQYYSYSMNALHETAWQLKSDSVKPYEESSKLVATPVKRIARHAVSSTPDGLRKTKRSSKLSCVLRSVIQNALPDYFNTPYHASKMKNLSATPHSAAGSPS